MAHTFSGGIPFPHAVENKHLTNVLPLEEYTPRQVVIPLTQGLCEPCVPVVEAGQKVAAGQLVGRAEGPRGVPVHCGISGTVTAVEPRPIAGSECLCVIVDWDGGHTQAPALQHQPGADGLRRLMREAGLIGMGGAGFPTALKYESGRPIRLVLVNGCECEPYLTCDHALMLQKAEQVVAGAIAMGQAAGAVVKICVESNKPDAVERLRAAARSSGIEVAQLPAHYPQGGERQLIQAAAGVEVPAGALPADVGVLVSNAATAAALADAIAGRPLTHRIVTVSGRVPRPANLLVPVGTLLSDLLDHCGGLPDAPEGKKRRVVIAGGPMTGPELDRLDVPVTKATSGLIVLDQPVTKETNCIRCGACARVCPSRLMPFAIDAAVIAGDLDTCADYRAGQCIACGCCSYICPAKRYLAARVSLSRIGLRARAAAQRKDGGSK